MFYLSPTLLLLFITGCYGQQPVVNTTLGVVQGTSVSLANGHVIDSFLGVPYAEPPVGDLRFEVSDLYIEIMKRRIYVYLMYIEMYKYIYISIFTCMSHDYSVDQ